MRAAFLNAALTDVLHESIDAALTRPTLVTT
jgi:hypothetical protein